MPASSAIDDVNGPVAPDTSCAVPETPAQFLPPRHSRAGLEGTLQRSAAARTPPTRASAQRRRASPRSRSLGQQVPQRRGQRSGVARRDAAAAGARVGPDPRSRMSTRAPSQSKPRPLPILIGFVPIWLMMDRSATLLGSTRGEWGLPRGGSRSRRGGLRGATPLPTTTAPGPSRSRLRTSGLARRGSRVGARARPHLLLPCVLRGDGYARSPSRRLARPPARSLRPGRDRRGDDVPRVRVPAPAIRSIVRKGGASGDDSLHGCAPAPVRPHGRLRRGRVHAARGRDLVSPRAPVRAGRNTIWLPALIHFVIQGSIKVVEIPGTQMMGGRRSLDGRVRGDSVSRLPRSPTAAERRGCRRRCRSPPGGVGRTPCRSVRARARIASWRGGQSLDRRGGRLRRRRHPRHPDRVLPHGLGQPPLGRRPGIVPPEPIVPSPEDAPLGGGRRLQRRPEAGRDRLGARRERGRRAPQRRARKSQPAIVGRRVPWWNGAQPWPRGRRSERRRTAGPDRGPSRSREDRGPPGRRAGRVSSRRRLAGRRGKGTLPARARGREWRPPPGPRRSGRLGQSCPTLRRRRQRRLPVRSGPSPPGSDVPTSSSRAT